MYTAIAMAKKVHRFLVTQIPENRTITDLELLHHLYGVLKLEPGEHIRIFVDGGPEYEIKITTISKKELVFEIAAEVSQVSPIVPVTAVISIVKRDLFELVVEKLTELGVTTIIPLLAARTIKQSVRTDRLQKISDEALEQCGGTKRVHIAEPSNLKEVFASTKGNYIVFDTYQDAPLSSTPLSNEVTYFIGPEGGWTDEERALFKDHGAQTASLGTRVLRAETAAIVAADRILWRS